MGPNMRWVMRLGLVGLLAVPLAAQSALSLRTIDGVDLYYDDVLDITWLGNANLAATETFGVSDISSNGTMSFETVTDWIAAMNAVEFLGFTGWMLPTIAPINGTMFDTEFSNNASTDEGYAKSGADGGWRDSDGNPISQMGHMYYVNLGNLGYCIPDDVLTDSCDEQEGWDDVSSGPFANVQLFGQGYWSQSALSPQRWISYFTDGYQAGVPDGSKPVGQFAWPVLPGDVAAQVSPPLISDVLATPNPVAVQGIVAVTGTAAGSTAIVRAEWTLHGGSGAIEPADGTFDSATEGLYAALMAPYEAGIYDLCVNATDAAGNTSDDVCIGLVVYDPSAGFVTGGGWIWSPPGALVADSAAMGRANFGFVSRYRKGANVPDGSTQFVFQAGGLNFHSNTYEWLVVTGSNYARFKGAGTINGANAETGQPYQFMIWARDGSPDTFRIKIWYEDGEEVLVYDNGMDQSIGGGQIIVHTR